MTNYRLRFAYKALWIAVALILIHLIIIALRPCTKGRIPCSHASTKSPILKQIARDGAHQNSDNEWGMGLPPLSTRYVSDALKPRHSFKTYEEYIHLQLTKTMNPDLRKRWTSKDWRRKVDVLSLAFQDLMKTHLLKPTDKALCIAARVGQEVLALREAGVADSIGVDLVASPPLVVKGGMHRLPFDGETFDFEFSNAFDHALFPAMFVSEVKRTLKRGGIVALHIAPKRRPDKYSANDLLNIDALLHLFGEDFSVVRVRNVDAFGLDTEVVLRKRQQKGSLRQSEVVFDETAMAGRFCFCELSKWEEYVMNLVEPLIAEEPTKPWVTFKENAKRIKYLPSLTGIDGYRRYVYIDVGARGYGSSIGSWFAKSYPTQNHKFTIYALEADREVHFLPYAAWVVRRQPGEQGSGG